MAVKETTNYDDYIHEPNNKNLDHIPGDYGLPLIGSSIAFLTDPFAWAQALHKKYGLISRVSFFGSRNIMALGPDLAQQILLDSGQNFSSRMGYMDRVATFFPGSLIMEDFEHHKYQRRILQAAFKIDALKHYTQEINAIYDRTLTNWESDTGSDIKFFDHVKNLLIEVAAEIFVGEGKSSKNFDKLNQAFVDCVNGIMYIFPVNLPGFNYYKGIRGRNFLLKFFSQLVPNRRDGNGLDMLSHLCREKDEEGNFFTDEQIAKQMSLLLFAAHDTTTSALTHTIYYLARYPEAKETLYQECLALGKDTLNYEDLSSMTYMEQVFNEVQRMRPSVAIMPRRTRRDVEMGGYTIPAHTMVYNFPRFSHWMEEYWTEPTKFDPDRFSPERAEHKKHPFIFHPFGGGAHKCIGMHFSMMEYKCFLHKFMLKFNFEAKHKKDPKMLSLPLPKPADNMPIRLIRR